MVEVIRLKCINHTRSWILAITVAPRAVNQCLLASAGGEPLKGGGDASEGRCHIPLYLEFCLCSCIASSTVTSSLLPLNQYWVYLSGYAVPPWPRAFTARRDCSPWIYSDQPETQLDGYPSNTRLLHSRIACMGFCHGYILNRVYYQWSTWWCVVPIKVTNLAKFLNIRSS